MSKSCLGAFCSSAKVSYPLIAIVEGNAPAPQFTKQLPSIPVGEPKIGHEHFAAADPESHSAARLVAAVQTSWPSPRSSCADRNSVSRLSSTRGIFQDVCRLLHEPSDRVALNGMRWRLEIRSSERSAPAARETRSRNLAANGVPLQQTSREASVSCARLLSPPSHHCSAVALSGFNTSTISRAIPDTRLITPVWHNQCNGSSPTRDITGKERDRSQRIASGARSQF